VRNFIPYEKVTISVAEKSRPSHRAKIGVNTPGINRHKHTKMVKKKTTKMLEYFEKTRRLGIFHYFIFLG